MILYVIIAILLFALLIFLHELGHFLAAKAVNVRVNEFSICMGPAIVQRTVGETTYSLRCIPIGGYCAMEGEDDESDDPRAFASAAPWKRLVILAAGSAFNFLTGLLILLIVFSMQSRLTTPTIERFFPQSTVSAETGLREGDTFYSIDGERVYRYADVSILLERRTDGVHDLTVKRNGKRVALGEVPLTLRTYTVDGETVQRYGIYFANEDITPLSAVRISWNTALDFLRYTRFGLSDLLRGFAGLRELSGPVGVVSVMAQTGESAKTASEAANKLLLIAALIAVNLAVMNLLPLPALDGGRIFLLLVTLLIEKVLGRKLDPKYERYIHTAGMILLLVFMVVITFKDVIGLFR